MWRERGYDVVSPAEHDLQMGFNPEIATDEQGFDVQAALRWDIEQLLSPDMEASICSTAGRRHSALRLSTL